MVLASTALKCNLKEVAKMADSVMGVFWSSIATLDMPQGTNYRKLKGKVANLRRQLSESGVCRYHRCFGDSARHVLGFLLGDLWMV